MPFRRANRHAQAELDLVDKKIISALQAEGRLTVNELSNRVGLSASPCWTRVKRLEKHGIITGYAALIDHVAIGLPDVVFVEITLEKHDERVLDEFGEALSRMPEVIEANLVSGEYDYLVKVAVANTADYQRFLCEKLYRVHGIRQTRSTFALRSIKKTISVDPLKMDLNL
jgi:Lrp/AsnC family leucine-responsive transcriptional regulator